MKIIVNNVEILRLSTKPDSAGHIIPTNAFVDFEFLMNINYGTNDSSIGTALLRKVKNSIVADLVLQSKMTDKVKVIKLIKELFPAVSFQVLSAIDNKILHLKIIQLFLTKYKNDDLKIRKLGSKVECETIFEKELH